MGLDLCITAVAGATEDAVLDLVRAYAREEGNVLASVTGPVDEGYDFADLVVARGADGELLVQYPAPAFHYGALSETIAQTLKAPTFELMIYDSELWTYTFRAGGEALDRFNPIPDFASDNPSEAEKARWRGNAAVLAEHWPQLTSDRIERYLRCWEDEHGEVAYSDDRFRYGEEYQVFDFLRRLGIPWPGFAAGESAYQRFEIRTAAGDRAYFNPFQVDTAKRTGPLHAAAEQGDLAEIARLLDNGHDPAERDPAGHSPLHRAALEGQTAVLDLFIAQRGVDVDLRNINEATPLFKAAVTGHLAAAEYLLGAGADPNAKNITGQTPLACALTHPEIAEQLLARGARGTIHEAAFLRDTTLLRAWIEQDAAAVNAKRPSGQTPLHFAAQADNAAAVETLLAAGADPAVEDNAGLTPSALAAHAQAHRAAKSLEGKNPR